MTDLAIKVGAIYRAKRPRRSGTLFFPVVNDRMVLHVSPTHVQYDSPAVANGRHYPRVTLEQFRAWADREITLPPGEWAKW